MGLDDIFELFGKRKHHQRGDDARGRHGHHGRGGHGHGARRDWDERRQAATVACANCGAANGAATRFCSQCGDALPTQALATRRCQRCDADLAATAKFCSECGQAR